MEGTEIYIYIYIYICITIVTHSLLCIAYMHAFMAQVIICWLIIYIFSVFRAIQDGGDVSKTERVPARGTIIASAGGTTAPSARGTTTASARDTEHCKPNFLTNEEYTHLMLEVSGSVFLLVCSSWCVLATLFIRPDPEGFTRKL